jgi:hypothetical protein
MPFTPTKTTQRAECGTPMHVGGISLLDVGLSTREVAKITRILPPALVSQLKRFPYPHYQRNHPGHRSKLNKHSMSSNSYFTEWRR